VGHEKEYKSVYSPQEKMFYTVLFPALQVKPSPRYRLVRCSFAFLDVRTQMVSLLEEIIDLCGWGNIVAFCSQEREKT